MHPKTGSSSFFVQIGSQRVPGHPEAKSDQIPIRNGLLEAILEARAEGSHFTSIEDFCQRVDLRRVNKRALESIIKVGALDGLGHRLGLLHSLDRIMSLSQQRQQLQERGQTSMFDLWGQSMPVPMPSLEMDSVEVAPRERMSWEKELLGVFLSDTGLGEMAQRLPARGSETPLYCV